jgi:transporter family protein
MADWLIPAFLATLLWGIVGVLQKLGSNRLNASSLLVWVTAGYVVALPSFCWGSQLSSLGARSLLLGIVAGTVNGLGTWFLFAAFEHGAKASVAVPLTALYPLLTVALAYLFLAERLESLEWIGVFLALCAGAMLSYESSPG